MYLKAPLKSWFSPDNLTKVACIVPCHQEPSNMPDKLMQMPTKIIIIKNTYLIALVHKLHSIHL